MARFNDLQRVAHFKSTGRFPSIHDDIIHAVKEYTGDSKRCLDVGCCFGLLSARLVLECGKERIVGLEGNRTYLQNAIQLPQISYQSAYITKANLWAVSKLIASNRLNLVIARRVFPEIYDGIGHDGIKELARLFGISGIEKIVLEGRVNSGRSSHPLRSKEQEALSLSPYYSIKHEYKNCLVLERA